MITVFISFKIHHRHHDHHYHYHHQHCTAVMTQPVAITHQLTLRCAGLTVSSFVTNAQCFCHLSFIILDIDECTNGCNDCDVNANCTNTIDSFNCTCNTGYTGDGRLCSGNIETANHVLFSEWHRQTRKKEIGVLL